MFASRVLWADCVSAASFVADFFHRPLKRGTGCEGFGAVLLPVFVPAFLFERGDNLHHDRGGARDRDSCEG